MLAGTFAAQPELDTTWKEHFDQSVKHYREGDYRGAESSARMALVLSRRFDDSDSRRADTLIQVARSKLKLGRYQQALQSLDNADIILAKIRGKQPALEASSCQVRAEVYCLLGRNEDATTLAEKAHKARLKIHGTEHLETVESHDLLQYLNFGDGHKSLATREKLFGKGHPDTAASLVLIARIRAYDDVEKNLRDAMRLYQKVDKEHAELAEAWTQLGRHQRITGKTDEAGQTLEHALKHWKRLDPGHPRAAEALAELAMVRGQLGKIAEANKLYQEALKRHFSDLADDDLCAHFDHIPAARSIIWPDGGPRLNDLEGYLAEMIRRGGPAIEKSLAKQAKELTKRRQALRGDFISVPRNLEVLTAPAPRPKEDRSHRCPGQRAGEIEAMPFPHFPGYRRRPRQSGCKADAGRLHVGRQLSGWAAGTLAP